MMKKNLFLIGTLLILLFTIMITVNTIGAYGNDFSDSDNYYTNYHHGIMFNDDLNFDDYEFIYLHQSSDDQDVIDLWFAAELKVALFHTKTMEEVLLELEQIKLHIKSEYDYQMSFYGYGMMGRYGNRYTQSESDLFDTYEWVYIHQDNQQKILMDQMFASYFMDMDISQLSSVEIVDLIHDIKLTILNDIISLYPVID